MEANNWKHEQPSYFFDASAALYYRVAKVWVQILDDVKFVEAIEVEGGKEQFFKLVQEESTSLPQDASGTRCSQTLEYEMWHSILWLKKHYPALYEFAEVNLESVKTATVFRCATDHHGARLEAPWRGVVKIIFK